MEGAVVAGTVTQRAMAALQAGCDNVLLCNKPELADELLENMEGSMPAQSLARLARMHGKRKPAIMSRLHEDALFMQAVHNVGNVGKADGDLPFVT